ncbi:hypothetical protein T492DRAFT_952474 [Pavlovales sp. CCMP2436]|nr:hypothetical protein T492DRAFT_952474 [Pavlovales sp. CCMP2436]
MVTARWAPVVRISSAISARLRVVMLARGHSAPAAHHLSERRTLIGGRAGQAVIGWPSSHRMAIDDAADLMVTARRSPAVRTFPAIGTRPRLIACTRDHFAPSSPTTS